MMNTELSHKGYKGSCEVSIEDDCLHGHILDIDDLITYEGSTVRELQSAFASAVDAYLNHCTSIGKEPNKPYSGSFNVRIGPELHKAAVQRARETGKKLNELVRNAIEVAVAGNVVFPEVHNHVTINHIVRSENQVELSYSAEESTPWALPQKRSGLHVVKH
jgi:predicted HicB family RNase H-like nuclease